MNLMFQHSLELGGKLRNGFKKSVLYERERILTPNSHENERENAHSAEPFPQQSK
jgi:hypothetical protein